MLISAPVRRPIPDGPIAIRFIGVVCVFVVLWKGIGGWGMFNCECFSGSLLKS